MSLCVEKEHDPVNLLPSDMTYFTERKKIALAIVILSGLIVVSSLALSGHISFPPTTSLTAKLTLNIKLIALCSIGLIYLAVKIKEAYERHKISNKAFENHDYGFLFNWLTKVAQCYNAFTPKDKDVLSPIEQLAINSWTNTHFHKQMNAVLTGRLKHSIVSRINQTAIQALGKLPSYQSDHQPLLRGTNLGADKRASQFQVGEVHTTHRFMGSSIVRTGFLHGVDTNFEIYSKTGKNIAPYSSAPEETEVLFAPNTRFYVRGIRNQGNNFNDKIVVLEEVIGFIPGK